MLRLTPSEARRLGIVVNRKTNRAKITLKRPKDTVSHCNGVITLTIYDIPPSLNDWTNQHWSKNYKEKKRWEDLITTLLKRKNQLNNPIVRITYYPDINRSRDKDNYTPKYIMDGLKKSKIIIDDNTKVVDVDWSIHPEVSIHCKTEIKIWAGE